MPNSTKNMLNQLGHRANTSAKPLSVKSKAADTQMPTVKSKAAAPMPSSKEMSPEILASFLPIKDGQKNTPLK